MQPINVHIQSTRLIVQIACCQCRSAGDPMPDYNGLEIKPVKPEQVIPETALTGEMVTETRNVRYRGSYYDAVQHVYRCTESGQTFTDKALDAKNRSVLEDQYRELNNIPSPAEIRRIREQYGLSAREMSAVLGFGRTTWQRYEQGYVPQLSNARLIQLAGRQDNFDLLMALKNHEVLLQSN